MKIKILPATVIAITLSSILFFIVVKFDLYFIYLNLDTTKTITSTIIGASGAFLGFLVIYLSISLENLKKVYGQYAIDFFSKDKLVVGLVLIFILPILSGLLSLILSDGKSWFSTFLFNISCFYFCISVIFLIPYGRAILKKSSSFDDIDELINKISETDFIEDENNIATKISAIQLLDKSDKNQFRVIENLIHNSIPVNSKRSVAILIQLFEKLKKIVNNKNVDIKIKRSVTSAFANTIQSSFDLFNANKDFIGVKTTLAAAYSYNEIITSNKFNERFSEQLFEVMNYITQTLIECENEKLIEESLWVYYHMCNDQLKGNSPEEIEIWNYNEEYIETIKTRSAEAKENKFDKIDEFTTYRLNKVIERSFLCKNYHITENCVSMIGQFIEMIVFNENLGPIQKQKIGSTLCFYSQEAIKKFIANKAPIQSNYLSLYISSSNIISALEENSEFSKSVFYSFIDIFKYLIEQNYLEIYDIEKLAGIGRLIIAHANSIKDTNKYIEEILHVLRDLKSNYFKIIVTNHDRINKFDKEKKMIVQIQNDIKSFLGTMQRQNIINEDLKKVITEYI